MGIMVYSLLWARQDLYQQPSHAVFHKPNPVTGTIRRTSSRFCLGVEHGDYNGALAGRMMMADSPQKNIKP